MAFTTRCSDTFTGSGGLVGATLNNGSGGAATLTWLDLEHQGSGGVYPQDDGSGYAFSNGGDYNQVYVNDTAVLVQRTTCTNTQNKHSTSYWFVAARCTTGTGEGYSYRVYVNGTQGNAYKLQRMVNGTGTDIASGPASADGDVVQLEITGNNQIVVRINGTSQITFDDSASSSVPAGTGGLGNLGTFSAFTWETVAAATALIQPSCVGRVAVRRASFYSLRSL